MPSLGAALDGDDELRSACISIVGEAGAVDDQGNTLCLRDLLRRARWVAHPDRNQGDRRLWDLLDEKVTSHQGDSPITASRSTGSA